MTAEQFEKVTQLFKKQWEFEKCIENAKLAQDWEGLIIQLRRVKMSDFLGSFDIIRESFITEVQQKLDLINKEIEAI